MNKKLVISLLLALAFSGQVLASLVSTASGFISVDGGKLYYQQFGEKNGKPIIVLHGGPGLDSSYLLPQMSALAGKKNTVTFYDQRGSGKSLDFILNDQSINMQTFVSDLDKVRGAIAKDKIIIICHSWGALVGMNYALKYQKHVEKLIIVSGAPSSYSAFKLSIYEYIKRTQSIQPELTTIEKSKEYLTGSPKVVTDYFRKIFSVYFYKLENLNKLTLSFTKKSVLMGRKVAEILANNYLASYNIELQKLNIPVLIIHGENDIVPVSTAMVTHKSIIGSKIVIFKECDHFPYIEKQTEFLQTIHQFIEYNK